MNFPILNVRDLTKSYATGAGRLTVLHNVSFTLQQGATCSILGPSGSGKTTLLGLAAGLDLPTSGSVLLNGIALAEIRRTSAPGCAMSMSVLFFRISSSSRP